MRTVLLIASLLLAASLHALAADEAALQRYSEEARKAMAAQDWPAAVKALSELARLAPDVPEVHANLGLAYYSQNLVGQAAAEFAKALALNPDDARAGFMLGLCDAELGNNPAAIKLLE